MEKRALLLWSREKTVMIDRLFWGEMEKWSDCEVGSMRLVRWELRNRQESYIVGL